MSEMCAGCAFRKTCETWSEPRNRLVSQICAAGPLPFFCHTTLDWQNPASHAKPLGALVIEAKTRGGLKVCEGWKRAVAAREWPASRGLRLYQRFLAKSALLTADRFLVGEASQREMHRDLTALAQFYRGPRAWQMGRMLDDSISRLLEVPL
jgi:hypothetical protein